MGAGQVVAVDYSLRHEYGAKLNRQSYHTTAEIFEALAKEDCCQSIELENILLSARCVSRHEEHVFYGALSFDPLQDIPRLLSKPELIDGMTSDEASALKKVWDNYTWQSRPEMWKAYIDLRRGCKEFVEVEACSNPALYKGLFEKLETFCKMLEGVDSWELRRVKELIPKIQRYELTYDAAPEDPGFFRSFYGQGKLQHNNRIKMINDINLGLKRLAGELDLRLQIFSSSLRALPNIPKLEGAS